MENKKTLHLDSFEKGRIDEETYNKICELLSKHEQLKPLEELLKIENPAELLKDARKVFNGYLKSKEANDFDDRVDITSYQEALEVFLMALSKNKPALE